MENLFDYRWFKEWVQQDPHFNIDSHHKKDIDKAIEMTLDAMRDELASISDSVAIAIISEVYWIERRRANELAKFNKK